MYKRRRRASSREGRDLYNRTKLLALAEIRNDQSPSRLQCLLGYAALFCRINRQPAEESGVCYGMVQRVVKAPIHRRVLTRYQGLSRLLAFLLSYTLPFGHNCDCSCPNLNTMAQTGSAMFSMMDLSDSEKSQKFDDILDLIAHDHDMSNGCHGVTIMHNKAVQRRTGNHVPTYYGKFMAKPRVFEDPNLKPLPISIAVGLPILYRKDSSNDSTNRTVNDPDLGFTGLAVQHAGEINEAFEMFTTDIDPNSATYGKPTDTANCDVQLVRADKEHLEPEHVEALRMYLLLSPEKAAANPFTIKSKSFFECFKTCQHLEVLKNGNSAWAIPFPGKVSMRKEMVENSVSNLYCSWTDLSAKVAVRSLSTPTKHC